MVVGIAQIFSSIGLNAFGSTILIGLIILLIMAVFVFLMRGGMALGLFIGGILMFGLASAYGGVFMTFYVLGVVALGAAVALFFLGLR